MFGNILKKLLGTPKHEQFQDFKNRGAIIIDVRSSGEFQGGHPKNAKNIPLDKIASQAQAIKKMNKPIIVCCLSGGRSGQFSLELGGQFDRFFHSLNLFDNSDLSPTPT